MTATSGAQLLDAQLIETPDVLNVKFRKPEGRDYVNIEDLSHGQKCTAILVILLADGVTPVLIDQPEDALHAPWIEEYLVDRLRQLRGSRQVHVRDAEPRVGCKRRLRAVDHNACDSRQGVRSRRAVLSSATTSTNSHSTT